MIKINLLLNSNKLKKFNYGRDVCKEYVKNSIFFSWKYYILMRDLYDNIKKTEIDKLIKDFNFFE